MKNIWSGNIRKIDLLKTDIKFYLGIYKSEVVKYKKKEIEGR